MYGLAGRLADIDPETRRRHLLERTLSCRIPDLEVVFFGRLGGDGLDRIRAERHEDAVSGQAAARSAQVRFTIGSDDLLALVQGGLGFATAWVTGRVRVDASVMDLIRLRKLL